MIEFKEVRKSYKTKQVLKGINLTIADGEFMVLIGGLRQNNAFKNYKQVDKH